MSEVIEKLQRMLAQAQGFSRDAPLEAVARAKLAAREADAALAGSSGHEYEQIHALKVMALSRVELYEGRLTGWTEGVRDRADLFETHEQQRLEQPIPSKG
jgi:hypothetical protein